LKMNEGKEVPLSGIRILDLADEKASFCSKLLADLGAYVVKVEKPEGDPSRKLGPFIGSPPHPERSLFFNYHNTNKQGITLNLENKVGREIFMRLVKKSDVVVETFPPVYLKKLGLDFGVLSKENPKLIMVSVTGFGQDGPRCHYKSCDIAASAYGGQMYVSGSSLTAPLKPFGEQSYYAASLFAAIGILLALRKRNHSGRGEHIDISLQEAVVSTLEHGLVQYFYEKIVPRRQGNIHWNNSLCVVPCKDGPMIISLFQQWETLVEWMESEGMSEDLKEEKYKEADYRFRNLDHIIEVLQRWTKTHTRDELFELGQHMQFPWAPVCSPEMVYGNPQLEARGFFVDVEHPEMNASIRYPGIPYRFSMSSPRRWKKAPFIGEDNIQIYEEELGLSEKELKRLSLNHAI
jgi:crotonobetainyl-CoA:carnitine CoA-transferase CaiB-like acyl-CoA transferase